MSERGQSRVTGIDGYCTCTRTHIKQHHPLNLYILLLAKYMLDNSNNSDCGKIMKIHPNEEILLTSSGRAPKDVGFCSAVVYAVGKEDQNCHGVCMTVNSQYINVCHAKIQFKGVIFGKDDDPFRVNINLILYY